MTAEKKSTLQIVSTIVVIGATVFSGLIYAGGKFADAVIAFEKMKTAIEDVAVIKKDIQYLYKDGYTREKEIKEYVNQKLIEYNDKAIKATGK